MYMTIDIKRMRLSNKDDVIELFLTAVDERRLNKELSESIAHNVFDRTHPSQLTFELPHELVELRNEFGALEAPGLPEDDSDPDEYRDALWERLSLLVHEKRTV
jgi:hypothetical protein